MKAAEAQRAELIDIIDLRVVGAGPGSRSSRWRADHFAAPVARQTCYPNSQLFRFSGLSVRSQRQRVFSTPGLRRPMVAREVAIREVQSRD